MDTKQRVVRLIDADWKQLTKLAHHLVHDDEMPNGSRPTDPRVSVLLQKVARGEIALTRIEDS